MSREKFEALCAVSTERTPDGIYMLPVTQRMWEGWKLRDAEVEALQTRLDESVENEHLLSINREEMQLRLEQAERDVVRECENAMQGGGTLPCSEGAKEIRMMYPQHFKEGEHEPRHPTNAMARSVPVLPRQAHLQRTGRFSDTRRSRRKGELIAMVDACAPTDGDMEEEGKANARLIAAAPELLEALQDMYAGWKYIRSTHGSLYGVGWDRCDASARAALKKAGIE